MHINREIYGHLLPSAVLRQRPTTVTQPRESLAPTRPTRRELAELKGLRVHQGSGRRQMRGARLYPAAIPDLLSKGHRHDWPENCRRPR